MVYNNDAMSGVREDAETYYFIPREGGEVWLDSLSIPAKAPHRDLAEKFINYILDPKVGARVSNFTRTATPNKAALEFVDPADRKDPNIYPSPEVMTALNIPMTSVRKQALRRALDPDQSQVARCGPRASYRRVCCVTGMGWILT